MKKFLSSLLSLSFLLGITTPVVSIHGAESVIQFEIIAPASVKANEAFDVTVRAIDAQKNVVPSYRGSIIFASALFGDTVPMQGKAIQFSAEDNGEKKFSKATSFKDPGQKTISVVDLNDTDLSGETSVNVTAWDGGNPSQNTEPVTVISPEANSKITSDVVTVSGNTRKNSKVNIKLNWALAWTTTTDTNGIFTKTISGITQQTNIISVEVLDSSNSVIGTSSDVSVGKADIASSIYNVTISPSPTVTISSPIIVTIEADPGMSSVIATLDGVSLSAKEGDSTDGKGKYTINTVAPAKEGSFPIDISATNAIWTTIKKTSAVTLVATGATVEAPPPAPAFRNVQAVTEIGQRVTFTFWVENPPADLDKFRIVYGDTPNGFESSVTTYESGRILGTDGLYHWYVDKLEQKTYYFKVLGLKADGTTIAWLSSDPVSATIGKEGCTIGNVGAITVQALADKSILIWDPVPNAISYNIYKVLASGDQVLFQNVKENRYTLFLTPGEVTYEDFAIKALCDEKTESSVPSTASKVPTGPISIAFIVIISGILGAFILRRRAL